MISVRVQALGLLLATMTLSTYIHAQPAALDDSVKLRAEPVPDSLKNYVDAKDDAYAWEMISEEKLPLGKAYNLTLTSQVWQGIMWKHNLQILEPINLRYPKHVLLFVTGGRNGRALGPNDAQRGLALAVLCGARVAVIHQVPNQPLLGDHVEDDLITETWLKYLETGDETWPLLFPMVKSAVRAMDAVQEISAQHWSEKVESFVITGASKRGWTSWLAPVADKRIVATAPVVIDVLNFQDQMKHQLDTWGSYSEQINDYTRKGLIVTKDENAREKKLRVMMDPFTYREQLQLPKLIVNGTNDPYWVVDAMRWYWDDLSGPKYILQVPNAGHGLDGGIEYALSTVAAFFQHVASGTPMPEIHWEHSLTDDSIRISVSSDETPLDVRHWTSTSVDKDFRDEKWTSRKLRAADGSYTATIPRPVNYTANYVEFKYSINEVPYSICTRIYRD